MEVSILNTVVISIYISKCFLNTIMNRKGVD